MAANDGEQERASATGKKLTTLKLSVTITLVLPQQKSSQTLVLKINSLASGKLSGRKIVRQPLSAQFSPIFLLKH